MDIRKVFATNKRKEEEGVWVKGPDGAEFLIARAGNKNFTKLAGELMKPHRKLIQMGKADDALVAQLAAEVTSRTVLLNWRGVKEGDAEVPYTQEAACKMLIEYPDFADLISGFAQQISLFQDEQKEAATKN